MLFYDKSQIVKWQGESMMDKIKMFENRNIRTVWNEDEEEWYFSVVDVCWVLADSADFETAR